MCFSGKLVFDNKNKVSCWMLTHMYREACLMLALCVDNE